MVLAHKLSLEASHTGEKKIVFQQLYQPEKVFIIFVRVEVEFHVEWWQLASFIHAHTYINVKESQSSLS